MQYQTNLNIGETMINEENQYLQGLLEIKALAERWKAEANGATDAMSISSVLAVVNEYLP